MISWSHLRKTKQSGSRRSSIDRQWGEPSRSQKLSNLGDGEKKRSESREIELDSFPLSLSLSLSLSLKWIVHVFVKSITFPTPPISSPSIYSDTRASFSLLFLYLFLTDNWDRLSFCVLEVLNPVCLVRTAFPPSLLSSLSPSLYILSSPHTLWLFICANTSRPIQQQPGVTGRLLLALLVSLSPSIARALS